MKEGGKKMENEQECFTAWYERKIGTKEKGEGECFPPGPTKTHRMREENRRDVEWEKKNITNFPLINKFKINNIKI